MEFYLGNYWYLLLLLLLPILSIILFRYIKWRNTKRELFANQKFHVALFEKKTTFSKYFPILYLLGILFLILSLVDVLKGSEQVKTSQRLNNVLFVLDLSNSMNVQDIEPSRLEEAKNIIINTLPKLKNDRVGIVVFAGEAISIMPLTTDYSSVSTYIKGLETATMKVQGTDFLNAIQISAQKFSNIDKGSRKIILLSDGEDNEGNDSEAIKLANKEGISITTVGIGTNEGAPIPDYVFGQLMGYKSDSNGETVISKRETEALKKMAESTDGTYIDGNNLNDASNRIVEAINKKMSYSETMVKSQNALHYYQYFLAISLFFFILIYLFNPKRDFNI